MSKYLDTQGRFRTISLFVEYGYNEKYPPIYTLGASSKEKGGVVYPSLKDVYLSYDHIPGQEYFFAMDVFGSWDHWTWLASKTQVKGVIAEWRKELDIRNKAQAMRTILAQSRDREKGLQAARLLVTDEHLEKKRGRPSKEEVERNTKVAAGVRDDLEQDMARLGLKVVK